MTDKKLTVIINPHSGCSSKSGVDKLVEDKLSTMGFDVEIRYTTAPGDARKFAKESVDRGVYGVVALGGDGTVNEIASGLVGSDTVLAILPAGSGNGFARHFRIPMDISLALDVLEKGIIVDCDYGTVNGRPFFCTYGLGFDAAVSYRFSQQPKRGFGTYIRCALDEYKNYKPLKYQITIGDKCIEEEAFLVSVCNASQYGNDAFIAPEASVCDGLLDVVVVRDGSVFEKAWMSVEMFWGMIGNHGKIKVYRSDKIGIKCETGTYVHMDGEPDVLDGTAEIKCVKKGLRVFVPSPEIKIKPIITPLSYRMRRLGEFISRAFR